MSKIFSNAPLHSASPVCSSSMPWFSVSYSSRLVVGCFSSSLWCGRCLFRVVLLLLHWQTVESKGKMVCFDALLGTKLWIRCSFWIWCHNFRTSYSYAACRMHVNSRKWNETLFKYLHLVSLQFFAVIKIGAFDDLNRMLWLLHVLLSPPCIHSPKNIHFSNWQWFCIYFVIFGHSSVWTHAVFKKFFSSSQSAVFPLESRWFPKEYWRSNTPAISWEIGAMRLSTKLNSERSDVFTPCRKTTKSTIL